MTFLPVPGFCVPWLFLRGTGECFTRSLKSGSEAGTFLNDTGNKAGQLISKDAPSQCKSERSVIMKRYSGFPAEYKLPYYVHRTFTVMIQRDEGLWCIAVEWFKHMGANGTRNMASLKG